MRGTKPDGRCRVGPYELYDHGRYFTVTGQDIPGTPTTVEERTAEIAALHARLFPSGIREVGRPCSGVPKARQLEPDWRMAEPTRGAATRSLSHRRGMCTCDVRPSANRPNASSAPERLFEDLDNPRTPRAA